jgi:hypothetical protein
MSGKSLRRYMDIPALTYLLTNKKITLLDPTSWDDSNDSHYLSLYKESNHLETLLALCFTEADETYHHWRVFAGGTAGVCVRFDRIELLNSLEKHTGVRFEKVQYRTLLDLRRNKPSTKDLPFVKRNAFRPEGEFRVIFESPSVKQPKLDIPIPISCISRITLSPWAHKSLSDPLKKLLKSIDGCAGLNICRSTLISNEEWKNLGASAASSGSRAHISPDHRGLGTTARSSSL